MFKQTEDVIQNQKMRNAGRRRLPRDSSAADRKPPPAQIASGDPWSYIGVGSRRGSDASFCSSRPSSVGISLSTTCSVPTNDRGNQLSAIRAINSYLSSNSQQIILKPSLPSGKDVTETLKFTIAHLGFYLKKLEEDLFTVLKGLNCPIKLNKSALKSPGTPHIWPSLLAVIHWLVVNCMYDDHLISVIGSIIDGNEMLVNEIDSYMLFLRGDDDAAETVDREFIDQLLQEKDAVQEGVHLLEQNLKSLEANLENLRSEPSLIESRERDKHELENDLGKFQAIVDQYNGQLEILGKPLEVKEKEFEAKMVEDVKICEENEELRKQIEIQGINPRDAERMKKELQAAEWDIAEEETERNSWEEKAWDLDSTNNHKLKEIETLSMDSYQAIKRLKLVNTSQYELNPRGSTPAEVLGIDDKSTIKNALNSVANDIKNKSMEKMEESISRQQQSADTTAKIEAKRVHLSSLQSSVDEMEVETNWLKKDIQDYVSRCVTEAQKILDRVEAYTGKMEADENYVEIRMSNSKLELKETILRDEEETQMCARELFAKVDSVSNYKENVASKINEMKAKLAGNVKSISDVHRSSYDAQFGNILT